MADDLTSEPWFRQVTFYAVLAGLCPLIPIPFVDSAVLAQVKKRLVRDLAQASNVQVSEPQVAVLSGAAELQPQGCAAGCLSAGVKVVVGLVLRLFRKIVIVLTIKDAIDTASSTFHEALLLHHSFADRTGVLPPAEVPDERQQAARRIRTAIERVCAEVDTRPVNRAVGRVFRQSRRALAEGARILAGGRTRDDPEAPLPLDEEQAALGGVVDRLVEVLWAEAGYRTALLSAYDEAIDRDPV